MNIPKTIYAVQFAPDSLDYQRIWFETYAEIDDFMVGGDEEIIRVIRIDDDSTPIDDTENYATHYLARMLEKGVYDQESSLPRWITANADIEAIFSELNDEVITHQHYMEWISAEYYGSR